jgi:D-alanyl-D-alanine carboxypeptidase
MALVVLVAAGGCSSSSPGGQAVRDGPSASATPSTAQASGLVRFPDPSDSDLAPNIAAALDKVLLDAVRAGVGTGVSAAVVSASGQWAGVAGTSGAGRPLTENTSFSIASITKTFTAAEVMRLVEAGKVALDDKLSAYVQLPVDDLGATVRDALSMRSGIPEVEPPRNAVGNPDRHWSVNEILQYVPNEPAQPNVAFQYSSTNFLLLGQLIEKVSGTTWAQAVRTDLVKAAGPLRVTLQDEEPALPPVAWPARPLRGTEPYLPNRAVASAFFAAGCIAADARSVARWGYLLYGGHVLEPKSLEAMLPERDPAAYGFGTRSYKLSLHGIDAVGHDGDQRPFTSTLMVLRDEPLAAAVLITGNGKRSDVLADNLLRTVLETR